MELSHLQQASLASGEAVPVFEAGLPCILVRADVFKGLQARTYDDTEVAPRDCYAMLDRVMAADDANDPTLDSYQHHRRNP